MIITSIDNTPSSLREDGTCPVYVHALVGLVKEQCLPALCMELYLQKCTSQNCVGVPLDSRQGILDTVGSHISRWGQIAWPELWGDDLYCDIDMIKSFIPKANELLSKYFPNMAQTF